MDENNPVVQDLVNAGYSLEKCIDAVEKYESRKAAHEYLAREEDGEEEELGNGVVPMTFERHISREDSQDSPEMEWCVDYLSNNSVLCQDLSVKNQQ